MGGLKLRTTHRLCWDERLTRILNEVVRVLAELKWGQDTNIMLIVMSHWEIL